jgi:triacylglycerol lipase
MAKLRLVADQAQFMKNARVLIRLAIAAYSADPAEEEVFQETEFRAADTFSEAASDAFGFVASTPENVVIAFRGTDRIRDWWRTNLDFRTRRDLGGRVHLGFARSLDAIWDDMIDLLEAHRDNDQTIWMTGHSLGGAMTCLATEYIAPRLKPFASYTFGQPRVGNDSFAEAYESVLYRFVNNEDIIPTVPPRWAGFYTHVGEYQFFDADGNLIDPEATDETLGIASDLHAELISVNGSDARARTLIRRGFDDHDRLEYLRLVDENQD